MMSSKVKLNLHEFSVSYNWHNKQKWYNIIMVSDCIYIFLVV